MLIDNEEIGSINVYAINDSFSNIFLDLDKHYPLFKMLDVTNLCPKEYNSNSILYKLASKNQNDSYYVNRKWISPKDYNKDILTVFLDNNRTIDVLESKSNIHRTSDIAKQLINWTNLKSYLYYNNKITFGTYTLGINDKFLYCLCIKPEYIHYVKLCYLTRQEVEFDCFYLLARTNGNLLINNIVIRKLYNIINKSIKYFGTNVIFVDSIESEIGRTIALPKFNTMKDYNNWLITIKESFLINYKNNIPIEEPKVKEELQKPISANIISSYNSNQTYDTYVGSVDVTSIFNITAVQQVSTISTVSTNLNPF